MSSVSTSTTRLSSSEVRAVGLARMWGVGLRRECDVDLRLSVVVLATFVADRRKGVVVVLVAHR